MTRPLTVLWLAVRRSPVEVVAPAPESCTRGTPAYPGCVVPSTVNCLVMVDRLLATAMVTGPLPIENRIVAVPADEFALEIASRSVHSDASQLPVPGSFAE